MDILDRQQHRKPFREWLLSLCGYEIWPPTHNSPFIKGPRPRIITRRQADALRAMAGKPRNNRGRVHMVFCFT